MGRLSGTRAAGLFSGVFVRQLAFHAGRITTYAVLGAMVAALFHSLEVQRFSMLYRGFFIIFAGLLLLVIGLALLRVLPVSSIAARISMPGPLGRKIAALARSTSPAAPFGLGLATGLLPCGLSWAMLVSAASTLNPAAGLFAMISFGLGTTPLLFLTGISASLVSARTRLLGEKASACAVLVMGSVLVAKGAAMLAGIIDHCS